MRTKTPLKSKQVPVRFRALEEARQAVTTLHALKPLLSPQDEETLAILIDKELMRDLEQSVREEVQGKIVPLKTILNK